MARFEEFGNSQETVISCLGLLNSWLDRLQELTRSDIEQLRWKLDLLEYQITPKPGWQPGPIRQPSNPICAHPGCKAGWRTGLVNQADPSHDSVWYCQEHEPNYRVNGVSAPPGSPVPPGPLLAKATEMAERWSKFLAKLQAKAKPTSGAK